MKPWLASGPYSVVKCVMTPSTSSIESVRLARGYLLTNGKSKADRRRVPLTSPAAAILKLRVDSAKGAFIFPHEFDPEKPIIKVNNAHAGALKRSKIDRCRLYDFRHALRVGWRWPGLTW